MAHPRPDEQRLKVWRSFLRVHSGIVKQLERELNADAKMPLAWYDVLLQLVEAPERRLRMAELADRVLLSRSGLTRLVDRLSAEGYVTREPFPGDARGLYTVLTEAGLNRLRAAAPTHLAGVHQHFTSRLSDEQSRDFGELLSRLE